MSLLKIRFKIFIICSILILCSSCLGLQPPKSTPRRKLPRDTFYYTSKSYNTKEHQFRITFDDAVKIAKTKTQSILGHYIIVGNYYVFQELTGYEWRYYSKMPDYYPVRLTGWYINGLTGEADYREDNRIYTYLMKGKGANPGRIPRVMYEN